MNIQETLACAPEAMTVRRVYGEPFEKDGVTIIPRRPSVAAVAVRESVQEVESVGGKRL